MKRVIIASTAYNKISGKSWADFIKNLEAETGMKVDSAFKQSSEQFIELIADDGSIYEAEVTRYSDRTYEVTKDNIRKVD